MAILPPEKSSEVKVKEMAQGWYVTRGGLEIHI